MRLDGTVGEVDANGGFDLEVKTTVDTFADVPRAKAMLDLLEKDIEGSAAKSGSLLNTRALQPRNEGQQLVQQSCTQLLRQCGTQVVRATAPLLPCAGLAANLVMVGRCALLGAVAGPWGAVAAGATCAIQRGAPASPSARRRAWPESSGRTTTAARPPTTSRAPAARRRAAARAAARRCHRSLRGSEL